MVNNGIYMIYIYIYLGEFYITTEPCSPEPWNQESFSFYRGIIPKWPQEFRLVKHYNLPRSLDQVVHIIPHNRSTGVSLNNQPECIYIYIVVNNIHIVGELSFTHIYIHICICLITRIYIYPYIFL